MHLRVCVCVCLCVCLYSCACLRVYACVRVCGHVSVFVCPCMYVFILTIAFSNLNSGLFIDDFVKADGTTELGNYGPFLRMLQFVHVYELKKRHMISSG